MKYGLIGEKLGHSYSKIIHEKLADYTYHLMPLTQEEFKPFMEKKDFTAINVTIPYKQMVISYLDELHPLAKEIGAVNTIVNRSGHYIGYNTDFYGFEYMLLHNDIDVAGKKCFILGNGGTSRTAHAALKHLGAGDILIVSRARTEDTISYEEALMKHLDVDIIVNTTPLGMFPNMDASPLDLVFYPHCEAVVDVIFNPLQTKLIGQAQDLGMKAVSGLEMLVAQAKQAVEYFLDITLEEPVIDEIYHELLDLIKKKR